MSTKGLKISSASKSQDGSPKVPPRIKIPSVSVELSDNDDAQQNDATSPKSTNQYNFMHDPSTVLRPEEARESTKPGGNSPSGLSPSSGGLAPPSPSSDPDGNGHRKVSLMPLVTEEDLRSRPDLFRHDPQSVAELFGEDFASQLCVVRAASAIMMNSGSSSPLPYDPKEKMVRNLSGFGPIGPESARLPFEIRDNNLPE
ncbi:hypothetical protein Ddc_07582 [Ditylenchus destructor]|nr:hypothetical protein Ddc_07582 [Ditylenchus destructor]